MMSFRILSVLLAALSLLLFTLPLACDDDDDDDDDATDDDATDDDAADDDAVDDDSADDDDDSIGDDDDDDGGSWTDETSGLTWRIDPAPETMDLATGASYCQNLNANAQTWRLPTISELRSLIRGCAYTAPGGSCTVTDQCLVHADCWNTTCWDCDEGQGPANGNFWPIEMHGQGGWYWSASAITDFPGWMWAIPFYGGDIDGYDATLKVYVRCVREG
jgi:Protein of unknown function (DUF1566)